MADVQALVQASRSLEKPILAIPNEDSIICYRGCMPFATIYGDHKKWKKFSDAYKKRFPKGYSFNAINKEYREFLLNSENNWKNLSDVLDAVWKGMPNDAEKHTQHIIACNNQSFDDAAYSVCGVETCIPSEFMFNNHKPEIDFVAFCPDRREMLLIEYKCTYDSLYQKHGIREHWIDYIWIARNAEQINLVPQMLNAYNLLRKIEKKSPCTIAANDIAIRVAFLLTGDNYKGNKNYITKRANDSAVNEVLKMKELAEGVPFTDEERQNLLWGWQEKYQNVDFNTCFKPCT